MSLETLKGGIPMGNRNYTNYSKQNNQKKEEQIGGKVQTDETLTNPEPQSDENVQNLQENTETVTNTTPEAQTTQPEHEPTPPAVVTGVVVNCETLNIREKPSLFTEVLCIINKGEEVEIVEAESTNDFYAVIYGKDKEVSVEGFCMKKYIKLK
jgi:hypothetical protein